MIIAYVLYIITFSVHNPFSLICLSQNLMAAPKQSNGDHIVNKHQRLRLILFRGKIMQRDNNLVGESARQIAESAWDGSFRCWIEQEQHRRQGTCGTLA